MLPEPTQPLYKTTTCKQNINKMLSSNFKFWGINFSDSCIYWKKTFSHIDKVQCYNCRAAINGVSKAEQFFIKKLCTLYIPNLLWNLSSGSENVLRIINRPTMSWSCPDVSGQVVRFTFLKTEKTQSVHCTTTDAFELSECHCYSCLLCSTY